MSRDRAESTMARARKLAAGGERGAHDMRLISYDEEGKTGRYYLRGRWWAWAEVVVLRGGALLVHGDIDAVIFGGCHGYTSPRHVLEWMAYAGYDYAEEKASIGSSGRIAREFDPAVAMWRVLDWRRYKVLEREQARELYNGLRFGWGQHEFMEALAPMLDDCEGLDAGECTDHRVFNAQAVLRRLLFWLDAESFRDRSRAWLRRAA